MNKPPRKPPQTAPHHPPSPLFSCDISCDTSVMFRLLISYQIKTNSADKQGRRKNKKTKDKALQLTEKR